MRKEEIADMFVGKVLEGDNGILGNYVIAAEVLYDDHVELKVAVSEGISPWTAAGMFGTAKEIAIAHLPFYGGDYPEEDDIEDYGSG